MATVLLGDGPPELRTWLTRRQELGQDRNDEMWAGDHHVVPGPSAEHAMVDSQLARLLWPHVEQAGHFPLDGIQPRRTERLPGTRWWRAP